MAIPGLMLIGEAINDSVPSTKEMFDRGDLAGIQALAAEQAAAGAGEQVQAEARMAHHLGLATVEAAVQLGAEYRADMARLGLAPRRMVVALMHVVVGHARERGIWVVQRGAGHAPGTDRSAEQVHRVRAAAQPVAEDETIERVEHQPLRTTGRRRDHPHVRRPQATLPQPEPGARTGEDLQRLQRKVSAWA